MLEDNKGIYSVKSAYRLLYKTQVQHQVTVPGVNWLKIWSLFVPPNVKNFMRQAVQNCLPTLRNLRDRHVNVDILCLIYKTGEENHAYIFFNYLFARKCWETTQMFVQVSDAFTNGQGVLSLLNTLNTRI